jgi:nucleotide-binding universal stress UspA family protein
MKGLLTPPSVVVGIDGSRAATRAALWAVDEAVSRDVPVRLLCAIERAEQDDMAAKLVAAQSALRHATTAIEATGRLVKIETEISQGPSIRSLLRASASASMVCVGAVGLRHFRPERVGSTAAALAVSARCPVAVIRGDDNRLRRSADEIIVESDGSPDNGALLAAAVKEALLRDATLQAIVCRGSAPGEQAPKGEGLRRALADLDRRLACWKRRYPRLRVESVAAHGTLADYLAYHRRSVGLVIVGTHDRQRLGELVGPVGSAALQGAGCSLLIVNRRNL